MLPYGLAALLYGPLARSLDYKKILLFSLGAFSLSNLAAALSPHIYILFAARIFAGLCGAAIIPLSLILIAKTSASGERGKRVGGFFSLTFISSLLGLFLSGLIAWRWLFLLPAIGAALVYLGTYFYFPQTPSERKKLSFNYFRVLLDKQVLRMFIYIFSVSFLYHGIRLWLGVYFSRIYGLEQFLISMLLTTISISGCIGESIGGVLADRLGRIRVMDVGVILMFVSVIILLFKQVLIFLFAIMFIWGLGWAFNHVGVSTFLTDLPHRHLYESVSLNSSVRFLSGGLGALFGGILAQRAFHLEFAVFALGLLILFVFTKGLVIQGEA